MDFWPERPYGSYGASGPNYSLYVVRDLHNRILASNGGQPPGCVPFKPQGKTMSAFPPTVPLLHDPVLVSHGALLRDSHIVSFYLFCALTALFCVAAKVERPGAEDDNLW